MAEAGSFGPASGAGHVRHAGAAGGSGSGDFPARQYRGAVRVPPLADSQGNSLAGQWPLRSFLELGALPGAAPCARLHARLMLWEWRLSDLADAAEVVTSELITNAARISRADAPGAPVRLWLLADAVCVLILVWDASPRRPVRISAGEDDESGRGLLLVETLSARWNWYVPSQPAGGKVVWAFIRPE
ncbi:MAG TPA: ATP-binding protein [Streptosporangiaceae bacterium]|nr:ATP-binding protein [Streptosporangiaceae bacterium]